jgi:type IV pilus assembly protein PilM
MTLELPVGFDPEAKIAHDAALEPKTEAGSLIEGSHVATFSCCHCGSTNPTARKFCANCGKGLWETCIRCSTLSVAGEKYCGACGANLSEAVQEQVREFEMRLQEAIDLQAACEYDKAISLLRAIAKTEYAHLAEYAGRAAELAEEAVARRDRHVAEVQATHEKARDHASAWEYDKALELLETVPLSLRDEAVTDLLEQMQARQNEVDSLGELLRTATASGKLTPDLVPKLERLLELKPKHTRAQQISRRIREHLAAATRKKLARGQYDDALKLIKQVPGPVRTPEVMELHAQAAELAWLAWDLRHAPVVDKSLVAVAERLGRLAPTNGQPAGLQEELRRRAAITPEPPRFAVPSWATPPKHTQLGYPIDWITGFRRIGIRDTLDPAVFLEHPGCFFVACGLALRGLGQARLRVNLLPDDIGGVMGRVTRMMRKRPGHTAWGIDLGASGLKAIKLDRDKKGKEIVVEGVDFIEHRKPLGQAIDELEERTLVEGTLRTFLARNDVKSDRICVGLPGMMMLCRNLKLPPAPSSKIADMVRCQASAHLPFDLDKLAWDHQLLDDMDANEPTDGERPHGEHNVMLVAVKRPQLMSRLAWCQAVGLHVDVVQTDCLALGNLVAHEYFDEDEDKDEGGGRPDPSDAAMTAVLDIGSDATNLVISSPRAFWSRTNGIGGYSFTKALVREFRLAVGQAEQLKRNPMTADRASELHEAFRPVFENIVKEIDHAFTFFAKSERERPIRRILAVGGGFQLHGLLRYLRTGR